ncbi:alpha-(1,3)-fucosyltransferase C-like [Panulirus ornatus]|uniref:alpha-(1,3)-fucosyltransferase C-like n=1 Tax=Panulirus ornatus TaxID=150431 RepID=UPI003A846774
MKRRLQIWVSLVCLCAVLPQSFVVMRSIWAAVETTIDDYLSSYTQDHINYDYYEDLPKGLPTIDKRRLSVTLLKKIRELMHHQQPRKRSDDRKVVLFWTSWSRKAWWVRVRGGVDLHAAHCPEPRCDFTHDRRRQRDAAAILFQSEEVRLEDLPEGARDGSRRWVWVHVEAPPASVRSASSFFLSQHVEASQGRDLSELFNWTMTYHPASDVMEPYGALLPLLPEESPLSKAPTVATPFPSLRPALLDHTSAAYLAYMTALKRGYSLEEAVGPSWVPYVDRESEGVGKRWKSFLKRPRLVAWMSSHCRTASRREEYVKRLQQHVRVHVYGACGLLRCGRRGKHRDDRCWRQVLAPRYLFYLAFENAACDAYVTEKLWMPLIHGIVPVVLGGANYSNFLPPNSYIDALSLTPEELGRLLAKLQANPEEYARYHLWRGFWRATLRPPLCELCLKIHNDTEVVTQHDILGWWQRQGRCRDPLKDQNLL